MKMKEVCGATGLTERAVRFYVREGLVTPPSQERGGRTWLDFSEENVLRLRSIATLRKAGFTIDEIRSMGQDFQKNAPDAAFSLRKRLREAISSYERLSAADTALADDLESYAALLEREVRGQPVPRCDQRKSFSRVDWASVLEWTAMAVCAFLAWKLYIWAIDRLAWSFDIFALMLNPLTVLLPFVILPLPAALILGSKAGKWLYRHFEYVP